MGDARRRAALKTAEASRRKEWEALLDDRSKTILRVAERTSRALAIDGVCYRATLFLKYHLRQAYGIDSEAVIGYVNDGTDELYGYHAWLETDGLLTDVTICRPLAPELQKRGAVTILGREMASGWPYTYHRKRPANASAMMLTLMQNPDTREEIVGAEEQHARMIATARSDELIRAYLDDAPDDLSYQRLATMVDD